MMNGERPSPKSRPVVVVYAPACPQCGGDGITTQRSIDNGDGSRTRVTTCDDASCRCRFDIVVEPFIHEMDSGQSVAPKITIPASSQAGSQAMQNINVLSVGRCAQRLSVTVCDVRRLALEVGIEPAMVINGIDHFSERDLRYIGERLEQLRGMPLSDRKNIF